MTYRLQYFLTGVFTLIAVVLLALGSASANPASGGYQLFERAASGISADIQLASLENFASPPETASEYAIAINTGNGHNVIVHGQLNYDDLGGIPTINGRETNPAQIADAVRSNPNYVKGSQVCFASCWSGSSGTAQQLANDLGAPVFAPSRPVAWNSKTDVWIFDTDVFDPSDLPRPDIQPGWQTFYPSED